MSFSLTTEAMQVKTKTVTRRLGWTNLKPLMLLAACEKVMGRKSGEPVVHIGRIEVTSVIREPLRRMLDEPHYGKAECVREGFPDMTPAEFVAMFCRTHKAAPGSKKPCTPDTIITRIEFRHL